MNKYQLLYIFTYAPIGFMGPLIGPYLKTLGFSGTEIGVVTGFGTFVAIFAAGFWGKRFSRATYGTKLIGKLCIAAGIFALVCSYMDNFVIFAIAYGIMFFFQGPVMGLTDAVVIERNVNFANVRLFGSMGYAVAVFLGGKISQTFGLDKIFPLYALAFLIGAVLLFKMAYIDSNCKIVSNTNDVDEEKQPLISSSLGTYTYKDVLMNKHTLYLIIVGIFIFGSNVANNTYFSFLYMDGGGNLSGVGLAFLLMAGSEAPFMAITPILAKKFGGEKLILFAMVLSVLRFSLYGMGPNYNFLLWSFPLQGIVNGILLVEYVKYISRTVYLSANKKILGMAISIFYGISSSGGSIICNFLGGIAMDNFGSNGVYILFAILNGVGTLFYVIFGLHKKEHKSLNW